MFNRGTFRGGTQLARRVARRRVTGQVGNPDSASVVTKTGLGIAAVARRMGPLQRLDRVPLFSSLAAEKRPSSASSSGDDPFPSLLITAQGVTAQ